MDAGVRETINILANRALATGLSLECERLNRLDDLWTTYLADPENEDQLQDNLPDLQSIVGEMTVLVTSVSRKSRELRQLIREYPTDLDRELELVLENHPARDWLLEARPTPLAPLVVEACEVVERQAPQTILELAEKLDRIADGRFEQGDFRLSFKCAVLLVGIGATVLSAAAGPGALIVLPAAVAGGTGLVGAVASGVAGFAGWNCR